MENTSVSCSIGKKTPIIVFKRNYDGLEKVAAIEARADEYLQWPDTVRKAVASGRALIRRYIELNQRDDGKPLEIPVPEP